LTQVVQAAMPVVVNISSTRTIRIPEEGSLGPFFTDPFFRFFRNRERAPRREHSLGSGVLMSAEGVVLTNYHVIEKAQDIRVTLANRQEVEAQVIGADPKTDLAVLKLPGEHFPVLPLGDSDRVQVAETVLAIGNPFGLAQTVTMGIVSAVGRANVGIADYEDFIQTDAAINPGNSGGALINARGELIGINTAIVSEGGGYMGIGFAVPINMARRVMEQILTTGRVQRGWLGLVVQELTPALARGLGIPTVRGLLVTNVTEGGPAHHGGLQRGDIIVKFEEKFAADLGHFRNRVAEISPGQEIALTIYREAGEQTVPVTVGGLPEVELLSESAEVELGDLGLVVTGLTPDLAKRLGVPLDVRGAIVLDVIPDSPAHEAGLLPGDVIQEVNRQPIHVARDVKRTIEQVTSQSLVVLVSRDGIPTYLVIERFS
jgi:serine protease Do